MNKPNVVIIEPLTYIEREFAIAFVELGYEVEIVPRTLDDGVDFRLSTGEIINVYGQYVGAKDRLDRK